MGRQLTNRFGISLLSFFNRQYALKEEVIMNKETGQIFIKTPTTGDIISYDYLTRLNQHIQNMSVTSQLNNAHGNLYDFHPDRVELPAPIRTNFEYIMNPFNLGFKMNEKMVISIDLDTVNMEGGVDYFDGHRPSVIFDFTMKYINATKPLVVTLDLSKSDMMIINSDREYPYYELILNSLIFEKHIEDDMLETKHILHSMFFLQN